MKKDAMTRFGLSVLLCWLAVTTAVRCEEPYSEKQRITAVDLMVEFLPTKRGFKLPAYLTPNDFEVLYDGERRRVVDVDAVGAGQHSVSGEPWTLVVYFDLTFASQPGAVWAATELAYAADQLTALGPVELVVADPYPRAVLAATRDAEQLAGVLAEMALFPEAGEHELLVLRDELLDEMEKTEPVLPAAELFPLILAEEERLVRRRQDVLLSYLADVKGGARRALFLVSGGYDLVPRDFYASHLVRHAASPPRLAASEEPERGARDLGRTLSAYGWITVALAPPPPSPVPRGPRIGKWRLGQPTVDQAWEPDPVDPSRQRSVSLFNFFDLKREDHREPDKAESFRELGQTLVGQGDFEEAEQAFRMSLYHFAEDPKTASKQAEVLVELGEALRQLGRRRESRDAFLKARALDPRSAPEEEVGPIAELASPLEPIVRLTAATTGTVVRSAPALTEALRGLARRVRLSYQVPGDPDGKLHRVEVRCRRKKTEVVASSWARSATPEEVAAARVRRMLGDEIVDGEIALDVALRRAGGDAWRITGELEPPLLATAEDGKAVLRLTYGVGSPESVAVVAHRWLVPEELEDGRWAFDADFVPPPGEPGVAVLVEHLASGLWGTVVRELE